MKTTLAGMVFVLLKERMDSKPQKQSTLFANPFSAWTELAFKLWGFGQQPARAEGPEKPVAVAVIPTRDVRAAPKRATAKVRAKRKSKRARR